VRWITSKRSQNLRAFDGETDVNLEAFAEPPSVRDLIGEFVTSHN
jgi:hypothetical protein